MTFSVIGGKVSPQITVGLHGVPPVTAETIQEQAKGGTALGLQLVEKNAQEANGTKLAILGGGTSINDNVEKIKAWEGDIWSINGAYHWCNVVGVKKETTFIATDPHEIVAKWVMGVKKAIVATRSHPYVFQLLKENNAEIETFSLDEGRMIASGSSTASAAIHLAILKGYRDITFFGCEGSYPQGFTHGYMTEQREAEVIVRCNGEEFYTAPDFLMQSMELSAVLREVPHAIHEESGGLLRAMVAKPEYSIMWVSDGMFKMMLPVEEAQKLVEEEAKEMAELAKRKEIEDAHSQLAAWPNEEIKERCEDMFAREKGPGTSPKGNGAAP